MVNVHFPGIVEPVLPEALRPEVIQADKWWAQDVRPAGLMVADVPSLHRPAFIADPVLPEALRPETTHPDKWYAQDVRPIPARVINYQGSLFSDLTTFGSLFGAVVPAMSTWYQRHVYPTVLQVPALHRPPIIVDVYGIDRPETVSVDRWWSQEVYLLLQPRTEYRGILSDLVTFGDLFGAIPFPDAWFQPNTYPVMLQVQADSRGIFSDPGMVIFSDLFAAVVTDTGGSRKSGGILVYGLTHRRGTDRKSYRV